MRAHRLELAFDLAGKARFGKDWVGELPPRVERLVRRYLPSDNKPAAMGDDYIVGLGSPRVDRVLTEREKHLAQLLLAADPASCDTSAEGVQKYRKLLAEIMAAQAELPKSSPTPSDCGSQSEAPSTPPAELRPEVDRAHDLVAFRKHQRDEINRWIADRLIRWIEDGSLPLDWENDQPVAPRLIEEALKQDFGLVCKLGPSQRRKAGTKEIWNWSALKGPLKTRVQEKGRFELLAELISWCRERVEPKPGITPKSDEPDPKTIKEAIDRHELDKIAGPASG